MDWLQWLTAGGALTALGTALGTYLKTRPAMKAAQIQGEAALWARIEKLEAVTENAARECDERIDRVTSKLEAEIRVLRHDRNNLRQALNYTLASIKLLKNDELSCIAEVAEEMMARGDQTIALEKGAMAAVKGVIHDPNP